VTAELARVAGPVGVAGLGALFLASARTHRLAGLVAWALAALALAVYLAPHGHRAILAAAGVAGIVIAAAGAALLRRWPWLLPLAALACVPARIPVTVGSTDANLLIPLYAVVAAAALALAWQLAQGDAKARELGPVALPLAAFVGWTGLSLAWTQDLRQGAIELLAFFLPFGLLAICLARLDWRRRWVLALVGELVLMALIFAVVGVEQWITRDIFWNPKVLVGNTYAPFFRVNSLFWDPSIYGRFLVIAMLASLVVALWTRSLRIVLVAAGAIAVMAIGLLFSFSQSSFVALGVGVLVAAAFAWRRRALLLIGLAAGVFAIAVVGSPNVRHALVHGGKLNRVTSGRSSLVSNGLKLAVHHPVIGVGVGGFKHAYAKQQHLRTKEPKAAASHDTPITVAAETGAPGLALLVWLFVTGVLVAFRRVAGDLGGQAALAFGLILTAIGVHSLFYNAFFEDPMVWGALGLAAAAPLAVPPGGRAGFARAPGPSTSRKHEPAQPPQLDRQVEPERQEDQRVDGHKPQRTGERDMERLPEQG
jgi:putative inorganic carbon (HCO3(-)) transporter